MVHDEAQIKTSNIFINIYRWSMTKLNLNQVIHNRLLWCQINDIFPL